MSECLLRVRIDHTWYGDQPISGITLSPDAQTDAILHRFALWWRYDGAQWSLYSDRVGMRAALLAGLARELDSRPLCIRFVGNLDHLSSITALPPGSRTVPHYSSRAVDAGTGEDAVDLVLKPKSDAAAPPATIWLYPDDVARAVPGTTWCIRLEAARLPWIYFVVNRSQNPLNQPFMRTSDGQVLAGPVETQMPDGDTALRFDTGTQAWAFNRTPTLRLGLFDRFRSPLSGQTTEICLVRSMPLPASGAVRWDGDGPDRRVSAATIIYL